MYLLSSPRLHYRSPSKPDDHPSEPLHIFAYLIDYLQNQMIIHVCPLHIFASLIDYLRSQMIIQMNPPHINASLIYHLQSQMITNLCPFTLLPPFLITFRSPLDSLGSMCLIRMCVYLYFCNQSISTVAVCSTQTESLNSTLDPSKTFEKLSKTF